MNFSVKFVSTSLFLIFFLLVNTAIALSEAQYNSALSLVEIHFKDEVRKKGGNLKIHRLWQGSAINGIATRTGNGKTTWNVMMAGGLARHPKMTMDAFVLAACHELGHHIGGAPLFVGEWFTAEGQADYWASMKCARRIWLNEDNEALMRTRPIDPIVSFHCGNTWKDDQERALCTRIALSAQVLVEVLSSSKKPISFQSPDPTVVKTMLYGYPSSQCRLDTYFQGALCTKNLNDPVSNWSSSQGFCTKLDGFTIGARPRCWYFPFQGE